MCNIVLAFQRALWPGGEMTIHGPPPLDAPIHGSLYIYPGNLYGRLGILLVICMGLVWLAQRVFAHSQGNFAQEL